MHRLAWLVYLSGCQLVFPLESSPADGATPDAPEEPGACPTRAQSLVDPLRDTLKPGWEIRRSADAPTISATPGPTGLALTLGSEGRVDVYTLFAYDLDRSRFAVELATDLPTTDQNTVRFGVLAPAPQNQDSPGVATSFEWTLEDDQLVATFYDGNTRGVVGAGKGYDPVEHRFLGFSRIDDTLRWEVSADGILFTPLFDKTMPFRMVRPYMQNDRPTATPAPTAIFRDLNIQVTEADACPAASLVETFDRPDPFAWHPLKTDNCAIEVAAGAATMRSTLDGFQCEYASTGIFQLIGSSFDVAVPASPLPDDTDEIYVDIESITLTRVTLRIYRENGLLKVGGLARLSPAGNNQTVFEELAADERVFRFVGSRDLTGRGKITLLTSSDGVAFSERGEFAGLDGFEKARIILGGFGRMGTTISFAGVGVPP